MKRPIVSVIPWIIFLVTGALLAFAKTPTEEASQSAANVRPSVSAVETSIESVAATPTPTPEPTPVITWRDNPQVCDGSNQWISKDSPFDCIDKPGSAPASEPTSPQSAHIDQVPAPVTISGDKYRWMRSAGIPETDWQYADFIVTRESGWNPNAVNPSSGACGLGQQLPCGKWAGPWNDPVAALRAQHQYVVDRYGSYAGAYAFWLVNHWY